MVSDVSSTWNGPLDGKTTVFWVTKTRGFSGMDFFWLLRGIQVEARKCQETPSPNILKNMRGQTTGVEKSKEVSSKKGERLRDKHNIFSQIE